MAKLNVFSTGEIATRCRVSVRTVAHWIDKGLLKGYRIPGSDHRRVMREDLVKFLQEHKLPMGDLAPAA